MDQVARGRGSGVQLPYFELQLPSAMHTARRNAHRPPLKNM